MPGAPRSLRFCLRYPEKRENIAPVMQARDRQARVKIKTAGDLMTFSKTKTENNVCVVVNYAGAPHNAGFVLNTLKRLFRLSRVLLDL